MQKGEKMAVEEMVQAASYYEEQDTGITYFSGIVSAAMRNSTAYICQLTVEKASGEVLNTNCDCPAGKGPHGTCKHVIAILLIVEKLKTSGELLITGSCTDQLQSFKKPRVPHTGGPVAAEKLGHGVKEEDDDPRPLEFRGRPSYNDELYNGTVNYCAATGKDVSWRYWQPPVPISESYSYLADLREAQIDHHYFKKPFCMY